MKQVNDCGKRAAARYPDVTYWDYNWRKGGGSARMIEISKTSYIIAESGKIGVESTYCFAKLEKVDGIITEASLSETLTEAAEKLNVKIIPAE